MSSLERKWYWKIRTLIGSHHILKMEDWKWLSDIKRLGYIRERYWGTPLPV
jgi:hypothetical protein